MTTLDYDKIIEAMASAIADEASRNMTLGGDGEPVLYNYEGVAMAAFRAMQDALPAEHYCQQLKTLGRE